MTKWAVIGGAGLYGFGLLIEWLFRDTRIEALGEVARSIGLMVVVATAVHNYLD